MIDDDQLGDHVARLRSKPARQRRTIDDEALRERAVGSLHLTHGDQCGASCERERAPLERRDRDRDGRSRLDGDRRLAQRVVIELLPVDLVREVVLHVDVRIDLDHLPLGELRRPRGRDRDDEVAHDLIAKCSVAGEVVGLAEVGKVIVDRRRRRPSLGVDLEIAEHELVLGVLRER